MIDGCVRECQHNLFGDLMKINPYYNTVLLGLSGKEKTEWKLSDMKLRDTIIQSACIGVIGFGCLLFIIYQITREIYCLDTMLSNKWFKKIRQCS